MNLVVIAKALRMNAAAPPQKPLSAPSRPQAKGHGFKGAAAHGRPTASSGAPGLPLGTGLLSGAGGLRRGSPGGAKGRSAAVPLSLQDTVAYRAPCLLNPTNRRFLTTSLYAL